MTETYRTPRNTNADPALNAMLGIASAMSGPDGFSRFIEEQERNGQSELVHSDTLPVKMRPEQAEFESAGFTFGDPVPGDPMFRAATLPEGWKREGSDHQMWSYIVDQYGRRRVSIFYKAAFYDRDAFMTMGSLYSYLLDVLHDGGNVVFDASWATRETVAHELEVLVTREKKEAAEYRQIGMGAAAERHEELVRKAEALLASMRPVKS